MIAPNPILDGEITGDVHYHAAGSPARGNVTSMLKVNRNDKPELRKRSELFVGFKDPEKESITLYEYEADKAWKNFKKGCGEYESSS
jgi:hypothetical protein